jgi:hypothetical protein
MRLLAFAFGTCACIAASAALVPLRRASAQSPETKERAEGTTARPAPPHAALSALAPPPTIRATADDPIEHGGRLEGVIVDGENRVVKGWVRVRDGENQVVASVVSGDGHFDFAVDGGDYTIEVLDRGAVVARYLFHLERGEELRGIEIERASARTRVLTLEEEPDNDSGYVLDSEDTPDSVIVD